MRVPLERTGRTSGSDRNQRSPRILANALARSPVERPGLGVPRGPGPDTNEPPPAGPEGAHRHRIDGGRSAADLEDLPATDGAGALEGRLAVLHGDLLRVLDFDLLLVLDA